VANPNGLTVLVRGIPHHQFGHSAEHWELVLAEAYERKFGTEPEGFHAEELARIAIGFAYEGVKIIGDEAECIEVLLGSEELGFRTLDG
jgi:hypothetical protein